ncbi:hypothetical protein [Mycobacterium sp. SMC-17]|uniref:hypothetical protein n=1 Tax=Mycobacterium sp. SMC-17 TaxID=3381628 RepID=UPI003876C04C
MSVAETARPRIELVIVRDPDGPTEVYVYLNGTEVTDTDIVEYVVDAAAGHTSAEFHQARDAALATASPAAAAQLATVYADPPGRDDIIGGWPFDPVCDECEYEITDGSDPSTPGPDHKDTCSLHPGNID